MPRLLYQIHMGIIVILMHSFSAQFLAAKSGVDLDEVSRMEVYERISPVSKVCEIGQPCAENVGVMVASSNQSRSGEQIFNDYCTTCHKIGLMNSPKKDDKEEWDKRLKKAGGFDKILANTIDGIGNMPPKGTCMDCSDDELQKAVEYMSGLKP